MQKWFALSAVAAWFVASGCGEFVEEADAGLEADAGAGNPGLPGLPCAVSDMVNRRCNGCHGAPLKNSAPFPLLSRANFMEASAVDPALTVAVRSALRMRDTTLSMPPARYAQPTEDEKQAFEAWVNAGTPAVTCNQADGGTTVIDPVDAGGPAPTVCSSNVMWTKGNDGSSIMNPGLACRNCHLGVNFEGQNPDFTSNRNKAFYFMGTVFSTLHEKDRCKSVVPSGGGTVEIVDATGRVVSTMLVNQSGNFMSSSTRTTAVLPYTARVKANGRVRAMLTPQTEGDCNTCHTEQGRNGAPGRIVFP